jgi:hypothetical protein
MTYDESACNDHVWVQRQHSLIPCLVSDDKEYKLSHQNVSRSRSIIRRRSGLVDGAYALDWLMRIASMPCVSHTHFGQPRRWSYLVVFPSSLLQSLVSGSLLLARLSLLHCCFKPFEDGRDMSSVILDAFLKRRVAMWNPRLGLILHIRGYSRGREVLIIHGSESKIMDAGRIGSGRLIVGLPVHQMFGDGLFG